MKSPRHRAREFALQSLYQWQLTHHAVSAMEAQMQEVGGFDKADTVFFSRILRGTLEVVDELQDLIQVHLDRPYDALSPIERSVLLLATYELRYHIEAPYRVVLNEAIELAKSYGGTDGHKYVNGVLDKLAIELRPLELKRA